MALPGWTPPSALQPPQTRPDLPHGWGSAPFNTEIMPCKKQPLVSAKRGMLRLQTSPIYSFTAIEQSAFTLPCTQGKLARLCSLQQVQNPKMLLLAMGGNIA